MTADELEEHLLDLPPGGHGFRYRAIAELNEEGQRWAHDLQHEEFGNLNAHWHPQVVPS